MKTNTSIRNLMLAAKAILKDIPDDKWCTSIRHLGDRCCSLGHLENKFLGDVELLNIWKEGIEVNNRWINIVYCNNNESVVVSNLPKLSKIKSTKDRAIKFINLWLSNRYKKSFYHSNI